jgi:hypothetical protein
LKRFILLGTLFAMACASALPTVPVPPPIVTPPPIIEPIPVPTPDPIPVRPPSLSALHVDHAIFRQADGSPWRWKLSSMFYALRRWNQGEDLSALVAWTHQVGSNGWRVFCQYNFSDPSNPLRPGDISAEHIAGFVDWAATQQLYIELTVLTDTQSGAFNMTLDQEIARVRDVLQAVAGKPNVFVEIKNEPFKNGGRIVEIVDALGLRQKANRPVLMATGDYDIVGNEAGFFALDYMGDHAERKDSWPTEAGKLGHFVYDGWGPDANSPGWRGFRGQDVSVVEDEPIGAAEASVPGRRDANPDNWEDSGGGFGIGTAGATFHSDYGSLVSLNTPSSTPGPVQTAAATTFFAAMDFFPADAFTCSYTHDGLSDHPLRSGNSNAGETAARLCGTRAYAVAAQPNSSWTADPVNGWRLTAQSGHRNNLMRLER